MPDFSPATMRRCLARYASIGIALALLAVTPASSTDLFAPATPVAAFEYTKRYVPRAPDAKPSFRLGQRFVVVPSPFQPSTFIDPSGSTVPIGRIALEVLTLVAIDEKTPGQKRLTLSGPGGQKLTLQTDRPIDAIHHLEALLEDDTLRALRRRYEGKTVWAYGDLKLTCVNGDPWADRWFNFGLTTPYRVGHLFRTAGERAMAIGEPSAGVTERESQFTTIDPLLAVVQLAGKSAPEGAGGANINLEHEPAPMREYPARSCLGFYERNSDAWDFLRSFTLEDPRSTHPEWPAVMRKAVLAHTLKVGMTHDMAAWVRGFPSMYGTKDDMLRLNTWRYDYLHPWEFYVYFKDDRVVKFGPTGDLP